MMTQQYYTTLEQDSTYVIVDIQIDPNPPPSRMTVFKRLEHIDGKPVVLPATVRFTNFGERPASEVEQVISWIKAAQSVAANLDKLIVSREDFGKRLKVVGLSEYIGVAFEESEACNG